MFGTTLGSMDRFLTGTYDGTDMGSTDGTADVKFYVLLLVDSFGSLYEP